MNQERAFGDAAQMLARRVGLRLDPGARRRLSRCVSDGAGERGVDVPSYVALLDSDPSALQELLNRVTVQETAFFRDPVQFEVLVRDVLPTLSEPFTIWSAGCANGQEPYSLAMVLEEANLDRARVFTTDISTRALDRARSGVYSDREIGGLSDDRLHRFLAPADGGHSIVGDLRSRVEFAHHNLVGPVPLFTPGTCPVVFCRNVLIYFSHDQVVALLDRIADLLPVGGWLFLGYSESLWQVTDRFELVRLGEAFVYRRTASPVAVDGGSIDRPRPASSDAAAKRRARPRAVPRLPNRAPRTPQGPSPTTTEDPAAVPVEANRGSPNTVADRQLVELIAAGEAALSAGESATAITAFRKCVYLDPDQPAMHLHLGLALEASGDLAAARRSFAVARVALDACDSAVVEAMLDGYPVGELARLLDQKLVEIS